MEYAWCTVCLEIVASRKNSTEKDIYIMNIERNSTGHGACEFGGCNEKCDK